MIDCIGLVDGLPQMRFCMSMGRPSNPDAISPFRHRSALMIQHTVKHFRKFWQPKLFSRQRMHE